MRKAHHASRSGLMRTVLAEGHSTRRALPAATRRFLSSSPALAPSTRALHLSPISSLLPLLRRYSNRPQSGQDDHQRLTVAELARSLVESRKSGTLTTVQLYMAAEQPPLGGTLPLFGSLMPYILADDAVPIVGLRPDEKHVRNIENLDMASLVVRALFFRMWHCAQG